MDAIQHTIHHLRQHEEVVLHGNVVEHSAEAAQEVKSFLESEFQNESLDYPHSTPPFDAEAAFWGAVTVYRAAQLILDCNNRADDLPELLKAFSGDVTASAHVSADLCLRFLPDIISRAQSIDADDPIIALLEAQLTIWHYAGIAHKLAVDSLDFNVISSDACLLQMYCNRVIEHKRLPLAKLATLKGNIAASFGAYTLEFWPDIDLVKDNYAKH